jgi:TorA maturation chaperone TorD
MGERMDANAVAAEAADETNYNPAGGAPNSLPDEDRMRASFYALLAALLARPANDELLAACAALEGDDAPLGKAVSTLARLARTAQPKLVSREFHDLFIGLGRGELLPYASYYLTGFLHEKPLAKLRGDMAELGIERAEGVAEPEDNIASLMEMMAGLIRGEFGHVTEARQRDFFNTHIAPWAEHFFTDLEGAKASVLYAPVGTMGRLFMEIEKTAFRMEA